MVTHSNGGDQYMKHDPKLVHCQCGYCFRPGLWHKMVMLVTGSYVKRCPRCQCRMVLRLYNFVVCKERENVDKKELWKNG
jgi:hypothetical protein